MQKLRLAPPTITRDLTVGLVLVITLVFGLAGSANYFYSIDRDSKALIEKANEIMGNLASVLVTPMWDLNTAEIQKIVDVYRQSGIILDIEVMDDANHALIKKRPTDDAPFLELSRIIEHDNEVIGHVLVAFSDAEINAKQRHMASYSLAVFAVLTTSLILATTRLLKRVLTQPFSQLEDGLTLISNGDYNHRFADVRQADLAAINAKVTQMAGEIARREAALEGNRNKLEILNQAILDIFSCSDPQALVRTALQLSHKICGVDQGWFLAATESIQPGTPGDEQKLPPPLLAVNGQAFEASREEVLPFVGQPDTDKSFTFVIKSRYRALGTMTLAFDQAPDPSVLSLLKSLMSLSTLAMIRQSFIRETAVIAAELQVAETVQRSMLLDDDHLPQDGAVAYHYEPVLRVGGDWFSIIEPKGGGGLYVILGDVTGHGLAQGLVTTAMAGAIRVVESMIHLGGAQANPPSQIVSQLNSVIRKLAGKSNLRMTCVAAHLDFRSMQLKVCNGGHTFPILVRQETDGGDVPVRLETLSKNQQFMLGDETLAALAHTYTDAVYQFREQDLLVFYTDGLTEAEDPGGRPFHRKFHRQLSRLKGVSDVQTLRDDLLNLFRTHTSNVQVQDDICLLVVGKKPGLALQAA